MALLRYENIDVMVRTRDEHCPPHLHADCRDGWEARYEFSFLSDEVTFWDIKGSVFPTRATLNGLGMAIVQNLPKIRARWWGLMNTTCLENRFVKVSGVTVTLSERKHKGAIQIAKAFYDPTEQETSLILSDGSQHIITFPPSTRSRHKET